MYQIGWNRIYWHNLQRQRAAPQHIRAEQSRWVNSSWIAGIIKRINASSDGWSNIHPADGNWQFRVATADGAGRRRRRRRWQLTLDCRLCNLRRRTWLSACVFFITAFSLICFYIFPHFDSPTPRIIDSCDLDRGGRHHHPPLPLWCWLYGGGFIGGGVSLRPVVHLLSSNSIEDQ